MVKKRNNMKKEGNEYHVSKSEFGNLPHRLLC